MLGGVRFRILGPLEVTVGDQPAALGGRRARLLLAVLLAARGTPRRRDELIEAIWASERPKDAPHALDNLVSRLRKVIGSDLLRTAPGGYVLAVEPDAVDAWRFEALVTQGRSALDAGRASEALAALDAALSLWRGDVLADLDDEAAIAGEARRLDEARALAQEDRVDARLALGDHDLVLSELPDLVAEEPLRERRRGQLMLALHRSGRQAEALQAFRDAQLYLSSELGLEPSRALRDLELQIARDDPTLAAPRRRRIAPVDAPAPERRRRALMLGAVVTAALLAAGGNLLLRGGAAEPAVPLDGSGVALVRGGHVKTIGTREALGTLVGGRGVVWGLSRSTGTAVRFDLQRAAVTETAQSGELLSAGALANGDVWIADSARGRLTRLDGGSGRVVQRIPVGPSPVAVAAGFGAVWVASADDQTVRRIDPSTGALTATITLADTPAALATGAGGVWVAVPDARRVVRVNPRSHVVDAEVAVGAGARRLAAAGRAVWVANALDATVSRVDVGHGAVLATTPVGGVPTGLAAVGDDVWVTVRETRTLLRLSGASARVTQRVVMPGAPEAVAAIPGGAAASLRPPPLAHRGGTLRVRLAARVDSLDPGACCTTPPAVLRLLYDGLTGFDRSENAPTIVADLAVAVPSPTGGGRVYTFSLRPGLRYSSGSPVLASDVKRGIDRVLRADNEGVFTLGVIERVVADDAARTVAVHLHKPDGELPSRLALPVAAPVPDDAAARVGTAPVPGTGPYRVATWTAGRSIELERNPYFREWSPTAQPAARPDRIVIELGGDPSAAAEAVARGAADVSLDAPSPAVLRRLRRADPDRVHVQRLPSTDWTWLNAQSPPFDDIRVRRAVNLAVDRRAAVAAFGGSGFAFPACQLLPPGVPGHVSSCPYSKPRAADGTWRGPDLARARRLVTASGTRGASVTLWTFPDEPYGPSLSRVVIEALRKLGYRAHLRVYRKPSELPARRDRFQAGAAGIVAERASAAEFLAPILACRGFRRSRPGDVPYPGGDCDRRLVRAVATALRAGTARPAEARRAWAHADRRIVARAAVVPLVNEVAILVTGPRVGNAMTSPAAGPMLSQMWVR